jgi:hypothetical protein
VQEYTYWEMPGFIVVLAGWFALAGIGLLQARTLTVALGLLFLLVWSGVLRRLGIEDLRVRAAALALIGTDYYFVLDATYARSDMLSLVLFGTSLLVYLALRQERLDLAVPAASAFVVATGLTHPNAGLLAVIALTGVVIGDWRRLRPRHLALAALPFIVGAALWGAYIYRAPDLFAAQFSQNASNRFSAILDPIGSLAAELGRYRTAFGLGAHSTGTPPLVVLKAIVPLVWFVAVAACVTWPTIRGRRAARVLLGILGAFLLYYTFLEGTRTTYYLIWLVPVYSSLVALWLVAAWDRAGSHRLAAVAAVTALLAVQSAASLAKAWQQRGMAPFEQVVDYLRSVTPHEPITASIEFGYAFGFLSDAYVDDVSLGAWSGSPTRYVVVDERYRAYLPSPSVPVQAEVAEAGRRMLDRCQVAFDSRFYVVYRCHWDAAQAGQELARWRGPRRDAMGLAGSR